MSTKFLDVQYLSQYLSSKFLDVQYLMDVQYLSCG